MATDDDARARALEENRRRSEVMEQAQRFGPPIPLHACTRTSHEWLVGATWLYCGRCAATEPIPEAEPGVQLVTVPEG